MGTPGRRRGAARGRGLRWRVTAGLALGSLVLSSLLSLVTWNVATGYMLTQRQDGAWRQASANANVVGVLLALDAQAVPGLLDEVSALPTSTALLRREGIWAGAQDEVRAEQLPAALLELAESGTPGRQRVLIDGRPRLAVAVPLEEPGRIYVQVFSLDWLDRVFRFLALTLLVGTLVVAVLGAALARWASGRVLLPVTRLSAAAQAVSAGDLGTRLDADDDRDLAPLAQSFNQMTASLRQRVERDARFTSDVSHELRTPLMTMVNSAAVLQRRRENLPERARTALDLLTADLQRFSRLVTDLLEISKVDQGQRTLDLEPVDVAELTSRAASAAGLPPGAVHTPAARVVVLGDRRRLDRALANVLDNARLHAGGATRVTVSTAPGCVRVTVEDCGPGITADQRERVFERFARGRDRVQPLDDTGSGLGLALVREHVQLHGGQVHVEEGPAGGARFVLSVPEVPP